MLELCATFDRSDSRRRVRMRHISPLHLLRYLDEMSRPLTRLSIPQQMDTCLRFLRASAGVHFETYYPG